MIAGYVFISPWVIGFLVFGLLIAVLLNQRIGRA